MSFTAIINMPTLNKIWYCRVFGDGKVPPASKKFVENLPTSKINPTEAGMYYFIFILSVQNILTSLTFKLYC